MIGEDIGKIYKKQQLLTIDLFISNIISGGS